MKNRRETHKQILVPVTESTNKISEEKETQISSSVNVIEKELWTNKQRQMLSIHYTVSYRGSFKPELPNYFIQKYLNNDEFKLLKTKKLPIVFDPFVGRGTTVIQANLLGYAGWGNDINPMSEKIISTLTNPPAIEEIKERLASIPFDKERNKLLDKKEIKRFGLDAFYHNDTLKQLLNLKEYLRNSSRDYVDNFIEIIAMSRLHGHSSGFFSAYSFPQISVLPESQLKINQKHGNPQPKDVPVLILRKARSSLSDNDKFDKMLISRKQNKITSYDICNLPKKDYPDNSVDLIITSPPFLAQVDYVLDNWLECWFLDIEQESFKDDLVQTPSLETWKVFMTKALTQMLRVLKPKKHCIVEVGDVNCSINNKKTKINLDEIVEELGRKAGFIIQSRLIHKQKFTKLSNCFKVENNVKGVNTQRMVVFTKK